MKKYQKYKNTNIEWIGEIPERWDVISLGLISKIGSGTTPSSGNPKYYLEGDVNWLNTGDLKGRVINNTSRKITKEALIDYSTLKIYKKGCVAMAMYGATIGAISILGIDTTVNQACAIMEPLNKLDTKYLYYFLMLHFG